MRSGPGGVAPNGRAHHAYGEGSSVVLVGIKCGSGCGCRVYEIMMLSAWDALWDPADNPVPYCRVYAVDSPQIRSDIKDQSARKKHVCILLYNVHIVIRTVLRSQYHSVHSVQTPLDVRFYTTAQYGTQLIRHTSSQYSTVGSDSRGAVRTVQWTAYVTYTLPSHASFSNTVLRSRCYRVLYSAIGSVAST